MQPDQPVSRHAADSDVELLNLTKIFGGVYAVRDLSLRVEHGTFFSLLGPSGCGKTTTLRLIAGFEQPTEGRIMIGSQDVAGLPPYRRDCNTVFQSYALFPHMTVADNIAFGLRQKRLGRAEIATRVEEALALVRLPGAGKRRPAQLSGGQQQRVALARALVNRPTVLLLDEPLSALDLKLRKEMQSELKALQRAVGITFIYVTHDQEEAITLSDRIAVMHAGRIEQEDAPSAVYNRPQTRFVADFIGLTNFVEGTVIEAHSAGSGAAWVLVKTALGDIACAGYQPNVAADEPITLTLRPEKIHLLPLDAEPPAGWNVTSGMVVQASFMGPQSEYRVAINGAPGMSEQILTVRQQNSEMHAGAADLEAAGMVNDTAWQVFGPGERVTLAWRREATLILREQESGAHDNVGEDVAARPAQASSV